MKTNIDKVTAYCALCGDVPTRHLYWLRDHEYPETTTDTFSMVKCCDCGLVFLSPRPAQSELETIYPNDYFAFDLASTSSSGAGISVKSVSRVFERRRFTKIVEKFKRGPVNSIYDIGCGDGFDLDLAREIFGENLYTAGIEMAPLAAKKARDRGHQVTTGLFGEAPLPPKVFDLVISKHVIEHVAEPLSFLLSAAKLLSDEGILIIDTPNVASPLRYIFGRHWGGWHTPRHWYLFSPKTISRLAHAAGLEVRSIHQMPINTFWVWSLHSVLFDKNRRLAKKFFDPVGASRSGLSGVILLSVFQILEVAIKALTRRTSQMRIVLTLASN